MDKDGFAPCPYCGGTALGIGRGTEDREGFPTYVYWKPRPDNVFHLSREALSDE